MSTPTPGPDNGLRKPYSSAHVEHRYVVLDARIAALDAAVRSTPWVADAPSSAAIVERAERFEAWLLRPGGP